MHVLRYKESSILFVKFTVNGDKVKVHGCLGTATYIDREMPIQEARDYYANLLKEEWSKCPAKDAPRDWWFWN